MFARRRLSKLRRSANSSESSDQRRPKTGLSFWAELGVCGSVSSRTLAPLGAQQREPGLLASSGSSKKQKTRSHMSWTPQAMAGLVTLLGKTNEFVYVSGCP